MNAIDVYRLLVQARNAIAGQLPLQGEEPVTGRQFALLRKRGLIRTVSWEPSEGNPERYAITTAGESAIEAGEPGDDACAWCLAEGCDCLFCSSCADECRDEYCSHCDNCNDCCDCFFCNDCGDECTDDRCSRCDLCETCCGRHGDCFYCRGCRETRSSDNRCSGEDCDRCADCCSCGEEPATIAAGSRPFTQRGCRLVGVELEYNDVDDRSPITDFCDEWGAGDHPDGSCGREIVTAPMAGKHVVECMTALGEALKRAGASADDRCGLHVHVDAKDLTWSDMMRLLRVYSHVEPLLYLIAGHKRVENTYCRPCGKRYSAALASDDQKDAILRVAYERSHGSGRSHVRNCKPGKKDGGRYKGLNICPWLVGRRDNAKGRYTVYNDSGKPAGSKVAQRKPVKRDTTVEFRLHRNTLDTARVAAWALLLAQIVDYAARATDAEVQALPKSALRALCVIAPASRPWILQRIAAFRDATSVISRRIIVWRGQWFIRSEVC